MRQRERIERGGSHCSINQKYEKRIRGYNCGIDMKGQYYVNSREFSIDIVFPLAGWPVG